MEEVSEAAGSGSIISKKPRAHTDTNRSSFSRVDPISAVSEDITLKVPHKEHPTSARAAFYWALRDLVAKKVGLTAEGKAKSPVLIVLVHGIDNRPDADIIIAGGRKGLKSRQNIELASPEVIE